MNFGDICGRVLLYKKQHVHDNSFALEINQMEIRIQKAKQFLRHLMSQTDQNFPNIQKQEDQEYMKEIVKEGKNGDNCKAFQEEFEAFWHKKSHEVRVDMLEKTCQWIGIMKGASWCGIKASEWQHQTKLFNHLIHDLKSNPLIIIDMIHEKDFAKSEEDFVFQELKAYDLKLCKDKMLVKALSNLKCFIKYFVINSLAIMYKSLKEAKLIKSATLHRESSQGNVSPKPSLSLSLQNASKGEQEKSNLKMRKTSANDNSVVINEDVECKSCIQQIDNNSNSKSSDNVLTRDGSIGSSSGSDGDSDLMYHSYLYFDNQHAKYSKAFQPEPSSPITPILPKSKLDTEFGNNSVGITETQSQSQNQLSSNIRNHQRINHHSGEINESFGNIMIDNPFSQSIFPIFPTTTTTTSSSSSSSSTNGNSFSASSNFTSSQYFISPSTRSPQLLSSSSSPSSSPPLPPIQPIGRMPTSTKGSTPPNHLPYQSSLSASPPPSQISSSPLSSSPLLSGMSDHRNTVKIPKFKDDKQSPPNNIPNQHIKHPPSNNSGMNTSPTPSEKKKQESKGKGRHKPNIGASHHEQPIPAGDSIEEMGMGYHHYSHHGNISDSGEMGNNFDGEEDFDESLMKEVNQLKFEGNQYFRSQKYDDAIRSYGLALALLPPLPPKEELEKKGGIELVGIEAERALLHANRAATFLNLKAYKEVIAEASISLIMEPRHVKSLYRRGYAHEKLGNYHDACKDYEAAVQLKPDSQHLKDALMRAGMSAQKLQK